MSKVPLQGKQIFAKILVRLFSPLLTPGLTPDLTSGKAPENISIKPQMPKKKSLASLLISASLLLACLYAPVFYSPATYAFASNTEQSYHQKAEKGRGHAASKRKKIKRPDPKKANLIQQAVPASLAPAAAEQGFACPDSSQSYVSFGEGCVEEITDEKKVAISAVHVQSQTRLFVDFGVVLSTEEDITVKFKTKNPSLVVLADGRLEQTLVLPAGQAKTPGRVTLTGVKTGLAKIDISWIDPETGEDKFYLTHPVSVWQYDGVFDYNALGDKSASCVGAPGTASLAADMNQRTSCGKKPKAVASDGVSRLLMRLKAGAKGRACFKVFDDGSADSLDPAPESPVNFYGRFADPDSSADASELPTLEHSDDMHWGFGAYVPPSDFFLTEEASREVIVEIGYMPENPKLKGDYEKVEQSRRCEKVKIKRPPFLLIHGLASDHEKAFAPGENVGFYSPEFFENSVRRRPSGFDWSSNKPLEDPEHLNKLTQKLDGLMGQYREANIAVAQVDLAGHSMGGLLIRKFISDGKHRNESDFGAGILRKIALITSPQAGSQLANGMLNIHRNYSEPFDSRPPHDHDRKLEPLHTRFAMHQGAICSLVVNGMSVSHNAIEGQRYRAITASGGDEDGWTAGLSYLLRRFRFFTRAVHVEPYTFQTPNDGIVTVASQSAGLPVHAVENFSGFTHTKLTIGKDSITKGEEIARNLYHSLDLESWSGSKRWSDYLPAIQSTEDGITKIAKDSDGQAMDITIGRGAVVDGENYISQCGDNGAMSGQ